MRALTLLLLLCGLCLQGFAQVGSEHEGLKSQAEELFASGKYTEALPLYSQLVSLYPRDAALNYHFGTCALLGGEEKATAIKHLNFAARKNGPVEAWYYLGLAHHRNYDFDAAQDAYTTFQRKADDKLEAGYPVQRQLDMCKNGQGLLSKIVDVVVLDKTESAAAEFFRYYDLEGIGGKILSTPEDLLTKTDKKMEHQGVIHFPKGSNILYFSSYGPNTKTGKDLYQATLLEGDFIDVKKVEGPMNTDFDEDFPFMHPDGETLYFASKGHNSMGGYDIFMCKLDKQTGQWMPPVNLDFAINTPDDDLFYVADSLNQRAFFASARSSAASQLHVYEVMVQGIPVNLIFLQGTFLNELPEGSRKAKIEIIDELTGRPVASTTTDAVTGEYLFSMPKSGLYQVRVEAESSLYRHEGQIELPVVEASVAFKQELKLVDDQGQEKLIIDNYFDEPLDVDIAALSQEYLRASANLDINASEERMAQAANASNPDEGATLDTGAQPHWGAGFAQDLTLEEVFADSRKQADALEVEASRNGALAIQARNLADFHVKSAQEEVAKAREIWASADPSDRDQYMQTVQDYAAALKAADKAQLEAQSALKTAQALEQFADDKRQEAKDVRSHIETAESAWNAGKGNEAVEALRWEKDRQNDLADGEHTPSIDDRAKAYELQQKQLEILDAISSTNAEFDKQKRTERRLQEELDGGPKKARAKEIEEELTTLRASLVDLENTVEDDKHRVNKLSTEELTLLQKAALFDALRDGSAELPEGFDPTATPNGDLADNLRGLERDLAALDRNDDVLIALASDETIQTRNDISHIPALKARAEALGVQLELSAQLRERAEPYLDGWQGEPADYQRRAGLEMIQRTARQQQRVLDMVAPELQDPEQQKAFAAEQQELEVLLGNLDRQLQIMPMQALDVPTLNTVAAAQLVMPDYEQQRLAILQDSEGELEQVIRERALRKQVNAALESQLVQAQQAVLDTEDADEREAFALKAETLKAALLTFSASTEDIDAMKVAYESESAAIVASDEVYREKLGEQIRLTERYRQALEETRAERVNALNRTADPDLRAAIEENIATLDKALNDTDQRLATYSTDLENAVAVSEGGDLSDSAVSKVDTTSAETQAGNDTAAQDNSASTETSDTDQTEVDLTANADTSNTDESDASEPAVTNTTSNAGEETNADASSNLAENAGPTENAVAPTQESPSLESGSDTSEANTDLPQDQSTTTANEGMDQSTSTSDEGSGSDSTTEQDGTAANVGENPTSDSPQTSNASNPDVSSNDASSVTSNVLTEREALLLTTTLYPGFEKGLRSASTAGNNEEATRLLTELQNRVDREIAEQEGMRAALDDPFLNAEIDAEIQDLTALRTFTENGLMIVNEQGATALELPGEPEPLASASTGGNKPANNTAKPSGVASRQIAQTREDREFLADPIYENHDQVTVLRTEIGVMQMDLKAEDRKSKQRSIQKDIERKQAELAKEELTYQARLAQEAQVMYNRNDLALDSLETVFTEQLEFVSSRKESVDMYRSDASLKYQDAAKLRTQAAEERDNVKRNDLLNAALGLEAQAMELQEDAMRVFVPFESMLDEPQFAENTDAPSNAAEDAEPSTTSEEATDNSISEETGGEDVPTELAADVIAEVEVIPYAPVEITATVNDWGRENGIAPSTLDALANEPELVGVKQAFENVQVAAEEVNALRRERATLQAEVNTFRAQLDDSSLSQAEREAILREARAAQVRLNETEASVQSAEERLERYQQEAFELLAAADVAARAEAIESENNTSEEVANSTDVTDTPAEVITTPATSLPEAVAANLPATPPASPEALLTMPEVLEQPVFAMVEQPVYGEARRIPVGTPRPKGVIYCVQVGAYRNAIPQDLFAEFAPIYGDELNNGITRYTAGLFLQFANANEAKKAIRELGYKDAFVVAYRDGQRISITEARDASGDTGPVASTRLPAEPRTSTDTTRDSNTPAGVSTEANADNAQASENTSSETTTVTSPQQVVQQQPNYNYRPGAALATPVETMEGVFFTVQVGVYSKPVSAADLSNIDPLNTELLDGGRIRYTTGQFANLGEASVRKDQVRARGVSDAFVTAYVNGKRVTVQQARQALEGGQAAPREETVTAPPSEGVVKGYEVIIGSFRDEIPGSVAQAMLLLEGEYGIRQRIVGERTEYFTETVATRLQAEAIRDAFRKRGVEGVLIQEIR